MSTREIIQGYFDGVKAKGGWETFLADQMQFTIFTSPVESITDRAAALQRLKRFYSMASTVEVRDILVDGEKACVLARYELQPPQGPAFESHVAEVFEVRAGRITSYAIYFDTAPFPG